MIDKKMLEEKHIPGFWDFPLLIAIGILLSMILSTVFDNDTWWILAMGRSIIQDGIPTTEPLTMHQGMDFIAQQWLYSAFFSWIYETTGTVVLFIVGRIAQFALAVIIGLWCKQIGKNSQASGLAFIISSSAMIFCFGVLRPQVITYLILLTEVMLLDKYAKDGKIKRLIPIPFLSILQINLHASMWLMLTVLAVPYLAESIHVAMLKFVHSKNYEEWVEPRREYADSKADLIPLLCTVGAVFLGGLVNPYGFTAITYLFRSFGVDTINYLVSEMAAPSFTDSFVIVIFAFATVMLLGLSKKRLPIRYICLAAGTILLSMMHTKGFAYLLLFAIPIIGYSYSDKRFNISFFRRKFIPANYTRFMAILLGLTSLMVVVIKEVYITSSGDIRDTERYGWAEILEYAEENTDISKDSVIYAGYNSGGYLEFYGYRPYLDARAEIFLECNNHQFDYLNEFAVVNTNPLKVEEFVEKYGFEYMFVEQYSSIYEWFKYQGDNCRYELLYEYKETGKKKEQAEENLADEDRKMTLWRLKEPGDIAYDASN